MNKSTGAATRWLINHTSLSNPEQRRIRLLGLILLTLMLILVLTFIIVVVANRNDNHRLVLYSAITLFVLGTVSIAYTINLKGHPRLAAKLTVIAALVGQWSSVLLDTRILTYDVIPLTYVVIPILLCGLFLSTRLTILLITFQFSAMFFLFIFHTAFRAINWPSLFVFSLIVSGIGIVSSVVIHRDLEQMDKQTRSLIHTEAQLRVISVKDSQTGLFNRYYMEEELEKELENSIKSTLEFAILMLDIDNFKQINDCFGHIVGDEVLEKVAEELQKHIRNTDIACRFGGDEFVIILPDTTQEVAHARAKTIHQKIKALSFESEDYDLHAITISIGLASFPHHGATSCKLLTAADVALYQAKREGRDRVVLAEALA